MKKLLMSAALTAVLASPAFAQSYNAGYGTGNLINLPALEHGGTASARAAYASVPPRANARRARNNRVEESVSPNDPYTVYDEVRPICRPRSGSERAIGTASRRRT